jgi:hypothetical protein
MTYQIVSLVMTSAHIVPVRSILLFDKNGAVLSGAKKPAVLLQELELTGVHYG